MLDYFKKCLFAFNIKACLFTTAFSVQTFAQDQIVSLDISNPEILDGESTTVTVNYASTGGVLSTGLGLRLHFDSSALSCDQSSLTNLLDNLISGSKYQMITKISTVIVPLTSILILPG